MSMTVEPAKQPLCYSSHGFITSFKDIVEAEQERENEPFIDWNDVDIDPYADCSAIWVTTDPFQAFRYTLDAEESEESKEALEKIYPDWHDEIETVDCSNAMQIPETDDGDDGMVMIWVN